MTLIDNKALSHPTWRTEAPSHEPHERSRTARDEAKAETTDSLFNAGRLYTAIEDATKAITTDHDLQDVLINPANAADRESNVFAFQELAKEKLDVLVRSDSLVLNEYVASQWLDDVNGMIVGGLDSYTDIVMWGDVGVANFFIKKEDLERMDFSDVFYTWDCC